MEESSQPSEEILRDAIMELKEPVLFTGMLKNAQDTYTWKLLDWNLSELADRFGDIKLPFRIGYNAKSAEPQWEVNSDTVSMTFSEFLQRVDFPEDDNKWYYFDYKYMEEWFKDKSDIMTSLDWSRFGFPKAGPESTLWIGSKGAHTNCHQDSYGCNLVAQIHGRKQWLLFPPSSSDCLRPTRVPYEESTVYSKFNFFCPTKDSETAILKVPDNPKLITLEKGDVLLVPSKWWHYVESLDFSISVNVWLPVASDNESRVKEAIVKLIVARIGKKVCPVSEEAHCSLSYCMKLLELALKECKGEESIESPREKRVKCDTWTASDLSEQYPLYVKLLSDLEKMELEKLLENKRDRFESTIETKKVCNMTTKSLLSQRLTESVVNALCHTDVINKVAELLLTDKQ